MREVWDLAIQQLHEKLTSGEDLAPYVLSQIATTMARVKEKEEAPVLVEETDALASLESLPPERQLELLRERRALLFEQLQAIDERLASLLQ